MDTAGAAPTPVPKPKTDRFLIGILIGFAVLLVVAGLSVWLLRQPVRELPADTPGGVVQRFYRALEGHDYDAAYAYLASSMVDKPTRDEFASYNLTSRDGNQQRRIRIDRENIYGDNATVDAGVTYYYQSSWPFGGSDEWTSTETFGLRRENGQWLITELPYQYMPPAKIP